MDLMTIDSKRVCVFGMAFLFSVVAVAEQEKNNGSLTQPFSAKMVEYDNAANTVLSTGQLVVGKAGMRIESSGVPGTSPPTIYVQNFDTEQAWMMSPENRRYVELPMDEEDLDTAELEHDTGSGFMGTEPCQGQSKEKKNSLHWQSLEVDVWRCTRAKGGNLVQYFSPLLGMVVREETQHGRIKELRQIQPSAEPVSTLFAPPEDYYKVSMEEYFSDRIKLKRFQEDP